MSHTVCINVNSTGVSFTIVVCVSLSRVGLIGAVITPIPYSILIVVILPRVVHQWAVVLKVKCFIFNMVSRQNCILMLHIILVSVT